jgi:hypothetical protein
MTANAKLKRQAENEYSVPESQIWQSFRNAWPLLVNCMVLLHEAALFKLNRSRGGQMKRATATRSEMR